MTGGAGAMRRGARGYSAMAESLEVRRHLSATVILRPGTADTRTLSGLRSTWTVQNRGGTLGPNGTAGTPGAGSTANLSAGLTVFDASITNPNQGDAFDFGNSLWVNGSIFTPPGGVVTVDAADRSTELSAGPANMSGLKVGMEYHVAQNNATLRTIARFTNPGPADVTVPVSWVYNLGSDDATDVWGTSSGDRTFTAQDRWVVTDDADLNGGDPAVAAVLYGPGAGSLAPSSVSLRVFDALAKGGQGVLANYSVTVPAGQTRALMFFTQLDHSAGDGVIHASLFDTNPATDVPGFWGDVLAGLRPEDLEQMLNWRFNSPPVAEPDAYATDEDTLLVVDAPGILGNDTDPDGGDIVSVLLSGPARGIVRLRGDGAFEYQPRPNDNGTGTGADSFVYRARDSFGEWSEPTTVTIDIRPVNDAPVANPDFVYTAEDGAVTIPVLSNDRPGPSNESSQSLSIVSAGLAQHGTVAVNDDGTVTYTPDADFNGQDTFRYTVRDDGAPPLSDTTSGFVIINPVNDRPAVADGAAETDEDTPVLLDLRPFATDVETPASTLQYVITEGPRPEQGTISPAAGEPSDGVYTFTPAANFNGFVSLRFRVRDNGDPAGSDANALDSADAVATLTVKPVNDAPVADAGGDASADEGSAVAFESAGTDPDGDALSYAWDFGDGTSASTATASHAYADNGTFTAILTVTDPGGAVATDRRTVVVRNVAPSATIVGRTAGTVPEGDTVSLSAAVIDPGSADTHTYAWTVTRGPAGAIVAASADPFFSFTPGDDGAYVVNLTVTDDDGASAPAASESIAVGNVAPTAIAIDGPAAAVAGQALTYAAGFGDAGVLDTHAATVEWGDGTASAADVAESDGSGTALAGHVYRAPGTYTISLTLRDDDGGTRAVSRSVEVKAAALEPDPCGPGRTALFVGGTDGNDVILLTPSGQLGRVDVTMNGVSLGSFAPTGRIVVYAGGGDDTVHAAGAVATKTWMYGEDGNDSLNLGNGGGIAFGGFGNDQILGGSGRDILVGGEGADRIVSNPGDDVLLSAITRYDDRFSAAHEEAWCSLYAEWSNTSHTFRQRVDNLESGTGTATRLNGAFRLNNDTIDDDVAVDLIGTGDVLTGASGEDWFIYKSGEDRVSSMSAIEALEDLNII